MSEELTLNSPITEEQWDMLTDVDFDYTNEITFQTKHGKEVVFVKRKTGRWDDEGNCSVCGHCDWDCTESKWFKFCPNCGSYNGGGTWA